MAECNVLISSAGRRVALMNIFRAALTELRLDGRLIATDMSRLSAGFHSADVAAQVPRCTDPAFVPRMLELCQEHRVRLIIPTIDPELPVYAAAREQFRAIGTTINLSGAGTVDIGGDKRATHRWLTEQGFPTVRQAGVDEVLADPGAWTWPLIVKPARGSASIGVARVADADALAAAARSAPDPVVQELAPGLEHTVDVFVDRQSVCRCAVPRRRLEVRAGEVSKGMTVRSPELIELATRLAEALPGVYGVLNIQIFLDDKGTLNVIEINPRFGGGFPLTAAAGADYARWLLEDVLGRASSAHTEWQDGLVMLRYDDAVFVRASEAGV